MSASSLPVVWCSDHSSGENKPTAFALQGIHLQGNINEQHVLAVRELINAASEGRLLLPSDGGVVVLNCGGTGVGSLIISSNENKGGNTSSCNKDESKLISPLEKKDCDGERQERPIFSISNNANHEMLYEFLCCARCMSEGTKCCNNSNNNNNNADNLKIIEKYLDMKINAGKVTAIRRASNHQKAIKYRRKNKHSFKNENRAVAIKRVGSSFPIYATVNKPKIADRKPVLRRAVETNNAKPSQLFDNIIQHSPGDSFRKTSFDSTCTINSVDSGFIEMQSKAAAMTNLNTSNSNIKVEMPRVKVEEILSEDKENESTVDTQSLSWNRLTLTVPQQSRNRRKSYEEFKLLFCDPKNNPSNDSLSKSRRKSYEEFKSVTNEVCDNASDLKTSIRNNSEISESDITSINFFARMRRGSKRFSQKSLMKNSTSKKLNQETDKKENTIYDILKLRRENYNAIIKDNNANRKQFDYDKNLKLFESHCENNSQTQINKSIVNDNIKSCGTIYDIIQNKNVLSYVKEGKKYDKYMTYGTLYEILHRKCDEGEQFDRKRNFSEKFIIKPRVAENSQKNASASTKISSVLSFENNQINDNVTDTNGRNLNSSNSSDSLKQGSCIWNNQLSITSEYNKQLSTIYDILQTKKLDTTVVESHQSSSSNKNRFLVRKITEEELFELQKEETREHGNKTETKEINENDEQGANAMTNKKQTKLRRFSNILSYAPSKANNSSNDLMESNLSENSDKRFLNAMQKISNISIDDIYSRLNRSYLHQLENIPQNKLTKNVNNIYKSNSMDNILNAKEENEEFRLKKPIRKISVPVHLPPKVLPKKSTRRLSEFTRGEFLNEKL